MTFYGMHDAAGGIQLLNTFLNSKGLPLNVGDKKDFLIPWHFLNPFLEEALYRNGFLTQAGYKHDPDFKELKVVLKEANELISESPVNKKWIHGKNDSTFNSYINSIVESPKRLRQAYMAISMRSGDYIYIRGKKGTLNKGWVFKINDPTDFKFVWLKNNSNGSENYKQYFTLEAVARVPGNLYERLHARRASIWKLSANDSELLRNLIN
jgi:hypothetical protein